MSDDHYLNGHRKNSNLDFPGGSGRYRALRGDPIDPIPLTPGQRVKFHGDRYWFTVQAVSPRHVVLTRPGQFGQGSRYTIIAWDQDRRGPHDSWGYGAVTQEECEAVAAAMDAGEIELSERRAIYLDIKKVEGLAT